MEAAKASRGSGDAPHHAASSSTLDEGDVLRVKGAVAAAITTTLVKRGLTMRAAAAELYLDAADVQRIRNGDVARFSLDRLLRIAGRLGYGVELRLLNQASADPSA